MGVKFKHAFVHSHKPTNTVVRCGAWCLGKILHVKTYPHCSRLWCVVCGKKTGVGGGCKISTHLYTAASLQILL